MGQASFKCFSSSFKSGQARVYAELLLPDEEGPLPAAILCHGASSDHRAMKASAECMAKQGIASLVFDFRGHGLSSGVYDGNISDDVLAAFAHLTNYPEIDLTDVGLVGHSMGASAALLAAAELDSVGALVLLSCPRDEFDQPPREFLSNMGDSVIEYPDQGSVPWVGSVLGFVYRLWMKLQGKHMKVNWQRVFEVYKSGALSTALAKMKPCPILFVHCRGDRYSPYQSAVELYQRARAPKDIILEPGGSHSTPRVSRKIRNKWVSWLVAILSQDRKEDK